MWVSNYCCSFPLTYGSTWSTPNMTQTFNIFFFSIFFFFVCAQTVYQFPSSSFFCVHVFVALHSFHKNLRGRFMAALQAQTKLSSNEPGVCPRDLRGAATTNKTHKALRPWHWPSPRLPAILPLPYTAACCFVPAPSRGSSSHPLLEVALPPMPLFHKGSAECIHIHTRTHTCTRQGKTVYVFVSSPS